MGVEPMNPFELYAAKCCCRCGTTLEEQADCYRTTCYDCDGMTFYPLSPLQPSGKPIRFMQGCELIDDYCL